MATYTRQSDGLPVTEDEAMLNGMLKAGYRANFSLMTKDHAPGGNRIMMFDSTETRFMDALPSAQTAKINEIIADAGSNEVFRVQRARKSAMDMSYALGGAAYDSPSLTTDSYRRASLDGSAFMRALADQAFQHENSLYARAVQGDTTVNTGLDLNAGETAREKMKREQRDAWQNPQAAVEAKADAPTLTGDAHQDARARHIHELTNAWKA